MSGPKGKIDDQNSSGAYITPDELELLTGTGQSVAPEAEVQVSEGEESLPETLDYFANPQTLTDTSKQERLKRSVTKLFSPSLEDLRRGSVEIINKAHQAAEDIADIAADLGFEFSPANLTDRINELSSKLYSKGATTEEVAAAKKEIEGLYLTCGSIKEAKAQGKLRLEGKTYEVQDGDVITIRHSG